MQPALGTAKITIVFILEGPKLLNQCLPGRTMRRFAWLLYLPFLFGTAQQTDVAQTQLRAGRAALDSLNLDAALQAAGSALGSLQPGTEPYQAALLLMGDVFLERGEWAAAAQQYQDVLAQLPPTKQAQSPLAAAAWSGLGEVYYRKNDWKNAALYHQKALVARKAIFGERHETTASSYNNLGNCAAAEGRYAEALSLHRTALSLRQACLPPEHPDIATSYNNLGNCLLLSGDPQAALPLLETALRLRQKHHGERHPKTAQTYNNLGNCWVSLGHNSKAVQCYRSALAIRQATLGDRHPDLIPALENLGDCCFSSGDYVAALDYFRQALHLATEQGLTETTPAVASLLHNIGLCYQYEGDYAQALDLHRRAEMGLSKAWGGQKALAGYWNNVGNCHAALQQTTEAIRCLRRAETAYMDHRDNDPALAIVRNNLGTCLLDAAEREVPATRKALLTQALALFRATAHMLPPDAAETRSATLQHEADALARLGLWEEALSTGEAALRTAQSVGTYAQLQALAAQGKLCARMGLNARDTARLRRAIGIFGQALALSDTLRLGLSAPASRQRWTELQYPLLQQAVETSFGLWQIEGRETLLAQALAWAERYRNLQWFEGLRREQAQGLPGVPDSLLTQARWWAETLNRLEKYRFALLANVADPHDLSKIERDIAEARRQLVLLTDHLEQLSPVASQVPSQPEGLAERLRAQLHLRDQQRALVEYFRSDSAWYVFVLTPTDFKGIRLPMDTALVDDIRHLRQAIEAYPNAVGGVATRHAAEYTRLAHRLYLRMFAPLRSLCPLPKHLTVVPDGELSYLPFEALLTEPTAQPQRFKNHAYVLRDYTVAYAPSAAQLGMLLAMPPSKAPKSILTIAPNFQQNPFGLRPLAHNQPEAEAVARLLGGDALLGDAATASSFKDKAASYKILHLATHGQARPAVGALSWLAFSANTADPAEEKFVYIRDIYLQRLQADLVVLSACETSTGDYKRGEGVTSLANGFFQAGCRSVVATLWRVDDAKNADLMLRFFKHLRSGKAKDEALHLAKLDFLDAAPNDEAHPVFWAAALAQGDVRPINLNERSGWWWFGGLFLVIVVVIRMFFVLKNRYFIRFGNQ